MELMEDIRCTQLAPGQRYFSQLESVEFKFCFVIEKLKNVPDGICRVNVQFFLNSKLCLFIVRLFCCFVVI